MGPVLVALDGLDHSVPRRNVNVERPGRVEVMRFSCCYDSMKSVRWRVAATVARSEVDPCRRRLAVWPEHADMYASRWYYRFPRANWNR